jgi:hypothetical protein
MEPGRTLALESKIAQARLWASWGRATEIVIPAKTFFFALTVKMSRGQYGPLALAAASCDLSRGERLHRKLQRQIRQVKLNKLPRSDCPRNRRQPIMTLSVLQFIGFA